MEILQFEKCFLDVTGGNIKIKQIDYLTEGVIPIIDQGKLLIGGFTNNSESIVKCKIPCIIYGDHSRNVKYYDKPFAIGADGVKLLEATHRIVPKYGYYFLQTVKLPKAGYDRSFKYLKRITIPVPDLETQNKIVAILDKAKAILDKREATIKKYDELLRATFLEMFGDPILNPMGWNIKAFDKVGKFISGGTPDKNNIEFWTGNFPWVSPKDMKLPVISNAQDHVSEIVFNRTNLKRLEPNHLLIVVRGMILAHSFPTAINSVSVAINQDMKAILPFDDIGVLFLKNCLDIMKPQILNLVSTAGHGTKKFGSDAMSKLIIPIPPRNIQKLFENKARQLMKMSIRIKEYQNKTELLLKSLSQQVFSERITIDIDAELEALVNAIDLEKTDEQNKIETIINDVTFSQRLIDRLSEQQFEDKEQYDKAKYILFRIMKEEEGLVKQVFKNNEIQLTLQNETH